MDILKCPQNYCAGRCATSRRGNRSPLGGTRMRTPAKHLKKTVSVSLRITKTMAFRKRVSATRESSNPPIHYAGGFLGRMRPLRRGYLSPSRWKQAVFIDSTPPHHPPPPTNPP